MKLFQRRASYRPDFDRFPTAQFEPVLRSSICTGEQTACMRDRDTGKLHEIMVIRNSEDLEEFGKQYGVDIENMRTVY